MRHSNAFTLQTRSFITHCFCAVASCIVRRRRTAESTRLPAEHSDRAKSKDAALSGQKCRKLLAFYSSYPRAMVSRRCACPRQRRRTDP